MSVGKCIDAECYVVDRVLGTEAIIGGCKKEDGSYDRTFGEPDYSRMVR
jgi:hypothetical protein